MGSCTCGDASAGTRQAEKRGGSPGDTTSGRNEAEDVGEGGDDVGKEADDASRANLYRRDWVNFWERVAARQDGSRWDGVVAGMVRRRIIQFENAQSLHASVTDKEIEEQEMMMDKQQELLRREKLAADGEYHERRTAFEEGEKEGWLRSLEEEADTNREWFVGEDQEPEEPADDEEEEDDDAWRERDEWFQEKKAVFDRMEALVMGTTEECINLRVAEYEKEEVQFIQRRGEQFLKDMEAIDEEMLAIAGYMS